MALPSYEAKNLKDNIFAAYNQSGSGIPHYEGISFQRGYGLRGVFRRLFRAGLPFWEKGGKAIGKDALEHK
ncbi:hypothetical protein CDAR_96821 [Caerostris darwini]|uniref:Uncharacterized protein n=1 Tax=Caerostris darwini TaxID=1538125 RepID=A0AAV4SEG8_9ARAC|nr:hypothetical protein CDAR_96821 [Caerostris darwini]